MIAGDAITRVVTRLDAAGIPHMVAGSFASMFHGHPRTTHDVDIVIEPDAARLDELITSLPDSDYYADRDAARDALRRRTQFNVIDLTTGWKFDLIIRKARPFSVEEFGRRQSAVVAGAQVFVATAEDVIISKLEWAKLASSERQLQDVAGILAVRADTLDVPYIERWVAELALGDQWRQATATRRGRS